MSESQNKIFLLTGRTGNGKSSTGNFFLSGLYFLHHYMRILRYSATVTGRTITVIDGTGIGDTGEDLACSAETLLENMREALKDDGFDVLVFVLKYGVRFTKQEKDAVQRVKDMFGEDVFKTRGVIVMTYGDNFQHDNEDENNEFVDWCRRQSGEFKNLFEEVQHRVVLVNNKTKDKTATQKEFFALTDKLNVGNYTITDFDKNKTKHDFIVVNENCPNHIKVVKVFIATVHAQIKKHYFTYASDRKMLVSELEACKKQLEEKLKQIRYEDKGTKILRDLEDSLSLEVLTLNSKLNGLRLNLKGNDESKKTKKDVWVVCKTIGILVGGGLLVYFSCIFLYRLYRHRFTDPAAPNTIWTYGRFSQSRSLCGKMTEKILIENTDEMLTKCIGVRGEDWEKGDWIGDGGFGTIYLVKFLKDNREPKYVVKEIRVYKNSEQQNIVESFKTETEILKKIGCHKRIVPFIGASKCDDILSIFMGYMKQGSLRTYSEKKNGLGEEETRRFTKQILKGLKFLHGNKIIHRDVKGDNVLMEDERHIRLTDFGISKILQDDSSTATVIGTERWMAPEVMGLQAGASTYNEKADIWSVGCTVIEMMTGCSPYCDIPKHQVPIQIDKGILPTLGASIVPTKELTDFLQKTLQPLPNNRPEAKDLLVNDIFINYKKEREIRYHKEQAK